MSERTTLSMKPIPEIADVRVEETGESKFTQRARIGRHEIRIDEPTSYGGLDSGPAPYDLMLAALGACTSMTVRLYAERKQWPLTKVSVHLKHNKIHAKDCEDCETRHGKLDEIQRMITLEGPLTDDQRQRLLEIANMCPVHRTLENEIKVRTTLAPADHTGAQR